MHKNISYSIMNNPKLLNHLMEHSYLIKHLNRHPDSFNTFQKQMKIVYKERPTDKIASAIDNVELLSSLIDTLE